LICVRRTLFLIPKSKYMALVLLARCFHWIIFPNLLSIRVVAMEV